MFDLKVVGQEEAELLIWAFWPTRIVSLTGHETLDYGPNHLHVNVHDVAFVGVNTISPSINHLEAVLEFTKDLTDEDRLLVHCHAGQSRSTAIAIAIMIQHGMPPQVAFDHVAAVRPILMPNQLFIQIIDEHFGLDGELNDCALIHRKASLDRTLILPSGPPSAKDVDSMKNLLQLLDLG
jgi:predicted protein tyrosine phosphatase